MVGGGQYLTTCGIANFAISAHAPAGVTAPGTAKGTWNFSLPASSACGKSSINSQVDCLAVAGNTADTTEHVTKASGTTLATLQGQELSVEAVDGAPDALSPDGGFLTTAPCNFDSESVTPILHGNIDVHDN